MIDGIYALSLSACHVIVSALSELLMTDDFCAELELECGYELSSESSSHVTKTGRGKETKTQSSEYLFCTV